jgi:hypothetical protein
MNKDIFYYLYIWIYLCWAACAKTHAQNNVLFLCLIWFHILYSANRMEQTIVALIYVHFYVLYVVHFVISLKFQRGGCPVPLWIDACNLCLFWSLMIIWRYLYTLLCSVLHAHLFPCMWSMSQYLKAGSKLKTCHIEIQLQPLDIRKS